MSGDESLYIILTAEAIISTDLMQWVHSDSAGAVVVFHGRVRDNNKGKTVVSLEYEAYETMAVVMMRQLAAEARDRWHLERVGIVHRVGAVPIGEDAVVIAVSAAHRGEAFKACEYLIDRLKDVVPIWKKEITEEGSHWVGESRLFSEREDRSS